MSRFLWATGIAVILVAMACGGGGGSIDEAYIVEMNNLLQQHLDTYTNISNELDQQEDQLRRSLNPATAITLMREMQTVMKQAENTFEDVLNQWAILEPPEVARSFHARAFEMMQLRLNGARYNRTALDLYLATGEFDEDLMQDAADVWDESDRVYLDVLAEGRKVEKVSFK